MLPKTHITYDAVLQLSPHQSHVFEFADRWINNQLSEALISLAELISQQSAIPILATVQTMLSKWIKMKILCDELNESLSESKVSRKEIALSELAKHVSSELKLMPFSVEKDLRRLIKHTSKSLIAKKLELSRLEFLLKTGQIRDKHALELFVLKVDADIRGAF